MRVALAKFRDRIARLEHQRTEIDSVLEELRRASEQVERMLTDQQDGKPSDGKPRVRMKAARHDGGERIRRG